MRKEILIKCTHCNGTGKVPKLKRIRLKCKDCNDLNHGCFGSGKKSGLGYDHCIEVVKLYEK